MRIKKICCIGIIAFLFMIGMILIGHTPHTYSTNENRELTAVPKFHISSFLDGSFQEKLDTALSDQFPGREQMMKTGTVLKLILGRKDVGDAYIGKDHYYFEKVTENDISKGNFITNLSAIEMLAEQNPNVDFTMMAVPSSGIVLSDLLPKNAPIYDYQGLIDTARETLTNVALVDPTEDLKLAAGSSQVYYRTDHHWTSYGAYIGYQALMGANAKYGEYSGTIATDSFLGTLYSRTLDVNAIPDSIELPTVSDNVSVKVDGEKSTLYDVTKLKKKDKYQVFEGGNFGCVEISGIGSGTLLIIKDSFANSLVPYLTADYEKIIMIDLRYYGGTVKNLMASEQIDQVLVLYELNNFATDSNLVKLYR